MNRYLTRAGLGICLVASSILLSGCGQTSGGLSDAELQGRGLFNLHCAPCHEDANPELKKQPPKLKGLFGSTTLPSGAPATDDQVRKTIIEGRGTMPAFDQRLNADDVDDLIKYLHRLR